MSREEMQAIRLAVTREEEARDARLGHRVALGPLRPSEVRGLL